jgi:hypothetical protein
MARLRELQRRTDELFRSSQGELFFYMHQQMLARYDAQGWRRASDR